MEPELGLFQEVLQEGTEGPGAEGARGRWTTMLMWILILIIVNSGL